MKILHIIPSLSPRDGGPSEAAVGMCRALEAIGLEVVVATTDSDGAGRLNVSIGVESRYEDVRVIFFRRDFGIGFKYSRGLAKWLEAHVRQFDLVHIHAVFNHSSIAAARSCRHAGIPYMLRPAGTLDPWSLGRSRIRKRVFLATFGRRLLAGAKSLHFTTELERTRTLAAIGDRPSFVLPLGVTPVAQARTSPESAPEIQLPYVLFLSRIAAKKNLSVLMQAFAGAINDPPQTGEGDLVPVLTPGPSPQPVERGARACAPKLAERRREGGVRMESRRLSDWKLIIAGDGEASEVDALHRLAAKLGIAERVMFTGWLDGQPKQEILAHASLFILPSLHENFGLVVAEAMAAGVPVLVSPDVALAAEVERACAGWVIEATVAALGERLPSILNDAVELARRGEAGRRFAEEHFRWDRIAVGLIEIYKSLTRPPGVVLTPIPSPQLVERGVREDGVRM